MSDCPTAIANAIFGGSAEYVALWFKSAGAEANFYWYVTGLCAISFIAAMIMPTRGPRWLSTRRRHWSEHAVAHGRSDETCGASVVFSS